MSKVKLALALALVGLVILSCSLCLLLYSHLPYDRTTKRYEVPAENLKRPSPTPESWAPKDSHSVAESYWPSSGVEGAGEVWRAVV